MTFFEITVMRNKVMWESSIQMWRKIQQKTWKAHVRMVKESEVKVSEVEHSTARHLDEVSWRSLADGVDGLPLSCLPLRQIIAQYVFYHSPCAEDGLCKALRPAQLDIHIVLFCLVFFILSYLISYQCYNSNNHHFHSVSRQLRHMAVHDKLCMHFPIIFVTHCNLIVWKPSSSPSLRLLYFSTSLLHYFSTSILSLFFVLLLFFLSSFFLFFFSSVLTGSF